MSIFSYDPLAAETWLIQNAMWINAVVSPTLLLIAAYMSWPHSKRYPARFMAIAAAPMLGLHFIEKTAFDALGNHYAVLDHFNEWVSPRVEITHTPLTLTLALKKTNCGAKTSNIASKFMIFRQQISQISIKFLCSKLKISFQVFGGNGAGILRRDAVLDQWQHSPNRLGCRKKLKSTTQYFIRVIIPFKMPKNVSKFTKMHETRPKCCQI